MDVIDKLNDMIALDIDAVHAYEAAIKRLEAIELRQQLRQFQADHERHVSALSAVVVKLGGTPRARGDVMGVLRQGFTAVTAMMGDESALRAMRGNEEMLARAYRAALDALWPDEVKTLLEQSYADEERHLAFVTEAEKMRRGYDEPRRVP